MRSPVRKERNDSFMKLLRVSASNFKNCRDDFTIDMVAKSKKTAEDKEYELQEIDSELYVYNTCGFVGKNASGKTTAIELLDCCYSILGDFRLENKHYSFDNVKLDIFFYHDGYIYRYKTTLHNDSALSGKAVFSDQHIYRKKYFKTNVKKIYDEADFEKVQINGELPEDTSDIFFVLKKKRTYAVYFDSNGRGANTYADIFRIIKAYNVPTDIFLNLLMIFDENISSLEMIGDHNFAITYQNEKKRVSDDDLFWLLSSGTTKGLLLYIMMAVSLREGFDIIIDEIENHFHKTLVENMISLYKDKSVNKYAATLIFTTHYCEILDLFSRQDNIWIAKSDGKITLTNLYEGYNIRTELLKSRQFYNNAFQTAVNYEELMNLKRKLKA